ncbi:MAG: serine protease [Candidatus Scalindua sp.]|nr:serine protease [Candidatus Scalindua sp.]MCR4345073.1 serine protease [Candidatus Scalindua sp.]
MKYLTTGVLILLVAFLSLFHTPHTNICYSANPSSTIVNNVYSSVVLITDTEIKISIWDALTFASYFTVGVGNPVPVHIEKTGGTGFQTRWGIVTNSHVMKNKPKVVLTTFYKASYHIKNLTSINYRGQHVPGYDPKQMESTVKEATMFDWGDAGIDLALIRVKVPGAFVLPLAKEVKKGDKVFTLGHPKWEKFTPAIGSINRIYKRGGIKYIEMFIKNAPGSSGSPVLNMRGEVVGILWGGNTKHTIAQAVHVEELRKVFGLPMYKVPGRRQPIAIESRDRAVYSTEYSRLFHRPDCKALIINPGNLIEFPSRDDAIKNGGVACPECNP